MFDNKEDLKNKIIYRSSYRGTKEMDILMSSFVKSIIENLNINQLKELDDLVNLDDEKLVKIKEDKDNKKTTFILNKFKLFKL